MSLRKDDEGQVHTIEGIVAALVLVFAILYITGAINLVSPQIMKAMDMKQSVRAGDILTVLGSIDQPSNYSSELLRCISAWTGNEGSRTSAIGPGETSIEELDDTISSMVPLDADYNLYVTYWDDATRTTKTKELIYNGDPWNDAVSVSKIIAINGANVEHLPGSYWYDVVKPYSLARPKAVEVRLVIWSY